jgi:hypothetical protein
MHRLIMLPPWWQNGPPDRSHIINALLAYLRAKGYWF